MIWSIDMTVFLGHVIGLFIGRIIPFDILDLKNIELFYSFHDLTS